MGNSDKNKVKEEDLFIVEKGDWATAQASVKSVKDMQSLCMPLALSRLSGNRRRMATIENPEFTRDKLGEVLARRMVNRTIQGGQFEVSISELTQEIFGTDTEERRKAVLEAIGDLNDLLKE